MREIANNLISFRMSYMSEIIVYHNVLKDNICALFIGDGGFDLHLWVYSKSDIRGMIDNKIDFIKNDNLDLYHCKVIGVDEV